MLKCPTGSNSKFSASTGHLELSAATSNHRLDVGVNECPIQLLGTGNKYLAPTGDWENGHAYSMAKLG